MLDLFFAADLDESIVGEPRVIPTAHCARNACNSFRSTTAYPDPHFEGISDHCPVVLDLRRGDDDPS